MNISSPRSVRSTSIDEHDRHHHPEEALPSHPVADVVEADAGIGAEGFVVRPQQRVVVFAAKLVRQRAAEEVRDVGHRRTPGDGLPVHHGQRPVRARLAEKHVVQAVVAVDEAHDPVAGTLGGEVCIEAADESLAHRAVLGCDLIAVAVDEAGVQLTDQRLVHRRLAVQPVRLRHRLRHRTRARAAGPARPAPAWPVRLSRRGVRRRRRRARRHRAAGETRRCRRRSRRGSTRATGPPPRFGAMSV